MPRGFHHLDDAVVVRVLLVEVGGGALAHLGVDLVQLEEQRVDAVVHGFDVEADPLGFAQRDGIVVRWIAGVEIVADLAGAFLVVHVVRQDLLADAGGKCAGAVDRADHQRMHVREQRLVRIRGRVLGLLGPQADHAQQFVVAHADAVVVAIDGRQVVGQRSVDGREMRQGSHQDAVRAQGQHGCGRLALERRKYRQVLHIAAQQVDHAQRCLARAAVGLDEQRQPLDAAEFAQQRVEAGDVVLADGAFAGIPVGDDGLAERAGQLVEHRLGPLDQHRRLGRARAKHRKFGDRCSYRYRLVRQFGYRSILNCLEWLDISTMFIRPK